VALWVGQTMASQLNKVAYITGSSSGLGKALAELLLDHDYFVIGISRTASIEHVNYQHVFLDLANINQVVDFQFQVDGKEVLLINNAGIIGDILPIGQTTSTSLQEVSNVNILAPQILINTFLATFLTKSTKGHIVNISSGAGKNPIDSWAAYCASKAALDLFSQTVALEFQLNGNHKWHIHSIAPGVVDTPMQAHIRNTSPEKFKSLNRFIELKQNGDLVSPEITAQKIFALINHPEKFKNTVLSVRDF
jgi:benzil reductase ((S)-benzoin forming)